MSGLERQPRRQPGTIPQPRIPLTNSQRFEDFINGACVIIGIVLRFSADTPRLACVHPGLGDSSLTRLPC